MTDLLEYEPFGALRSGGPVPDASHLFTGHERDLGASSSELDYMHARYYSPALARFVSVDTVGGDPSSSQSWNRYSYTQNNPSARWTRPASTRRTFTAASPACWRWQWA